MTMDEAGPRMAAPDEGGASLYGRFGGHEPVAAAVDVFYRRVVADAALMHHFAHLDLEQLRRHQAAFLDFVFGGPAVYRGRTLRRAHRGLEITAREFALVAAHLATALGECGVAEPLVTEVLGCVTALRDEVVGR
jgi:hemoglobin